MYTHDDHPERSEGRKNKPIPTPYHHTVKDKEYITHVVADAHSTTSMAHMTRTRVDGRILVVVSIYHEAKIQKTYQTT